MLTGCAGLEISGVRIANQRTRWLNQSAIGVGRVESASRSRPVRSSRSVGSRCVLRIRLVDDHRQERRLGRALAPDAADWVLPYVLGDAGQAAHCDAPEPVMRPLTGHVEVHETFIGGPRPASRGAAGGAPHLCTG